MPLDPEIKAAIDEALKVTVADAIKEVVAETRDQLKGVFEDATDGLKKNRDEAITRQKKAQAERDEHKARLDALNTGKPDPKDTRTQDERLADLSRQVQEAIDRPTQTNETKRLLETADRLLKGKPDPSSPHPYPVDPETGRIQIDLDQWDDSVRQAEYFKARMYCDEHGLKFDAITKRHDGNQTAPHTDDALPTAFEFNGRRFIHADEVNKRGGSVRMRAREGDYQSFKSGRDLPADALEHAKALAAGGDE